MTEKKLFKALRVVSASLTTIFIGMSYGSWQPVSWAGSFGMAVALLVLLLTPEEF